ncbi:MAG: GDSL-type esterase/lipase family protein [Planctomycetota bacterium]
MAGPRIAARQRLLFIGDSNTATEYRTRFPPHGYGYVMFVATMLAARHPELRLDVVNRGNDGDTIADLARRWQQDVLDLRPDHLFVLIGTNDIAYRHLPGDADRQVGDDSYAATLSRLLTRTRASTSATITLIEPMPFEIPPGHPQQANHDLERLCGCLAAVAREHGCGLVPVRAGLTAIMQRGEAGGWYQNFNHPAFPGHAYIAQQVLRHLGWQL